MTPEEIVKDEKDKALKLHTVTMLMADIRRYARNYDKDSPEVTVCTKVFKYLFTLKEIYKGE